MLRKWSALFLLMLAVPAAPAQEFFLKKGDVVVMIGDSITEQRLYSNYVEIWSQTRFPAYNLVFRNVGIGGDRSTGGNSRFKRDVLSNKPTAMTVDFGMNDGNYQWPGKIVGAKDAKREVTQKELDAAYATYMKGQQGIADQAKAANIRVAWVTPQPVENNPGDMNEKYNATLERYSAGVGEIAKKNDGLFVDQFHPYWEVIKKARDAGEKGRITAGDAVHPGPPGQAMMAAAILKGMGFPRDVSALELDATKDAGKAKNCKVGKIAKTGDGIAFERTDEALPFFPESAKSILKWTPLLEDMNYYGLKVSNLKPGNYDINIDGKKIATFSDKELGAGVNLASAALATGPIADQVKDVVKAVTDKTNYYHDQIFSLQRSNKSPDVVAERMKKMPDYDAAIRKALAPRPHSVEVVMAK
jgi:lysophospholipase L1-like esterase